MKIYFAHSTSFDFKTDLYDPIRSSLLLQKHELVFPHSRSDEQFDSKANMRSFDLVVAEVSHPSTGMGIELGWADFIGVPILAIYKEGTKPSSALSAVTRDLLEYKDVPHLVSEIGAYISGYERR